MRHCSNNTDLCTLTITIERTKVSQNFSSNIKMTHIIDPKRCKTWSITNSHKWKSFKNKTRGTTTTKPIIIIQTYAVYPPNKLLFATQSLPPTSSSTALFPFRAPSPFENQDPPSPSKPSSPLLPHHNHPIPPPDPALLAAIRSPGRLLLAPTIPPVGRAAVIGAGSRR